MRRSQIDSISQIGIGALDILLLFFLQAKLPAAGMPNQALGAALFFMEMGGILGAKVVLKWKKPKYRNVFAVTAALVLSGVFLEHSGISVDDARRLYCGVWRRYAAGQNEHDPAAYVSVKTAGYAYLHGILYFFDDYGSAVAACGDFVFSPYSAFP